MTNDEKKAKALAHLLDYPFDHNGCAELLGMGFLEFLAFRGTHLTEFQEVEERAYNLLEHLCMLKALGQELPEEYLHFDYQTAKWVLQCRKTGWSTTQKVQTVAAESKPAPTGKGKEIVDNYFSEKGNVDDGEGTSILSETARRNLQ